jgi:CRISPR/Cas system-associated protein Cas10 (large subunit of type III CRISPR-Cas system)
MRDWRLYLRILRQVANYEEALQERQGWDKCKYCGKKATRLHARHDNGELESLCEEHYSRWHEPLQSTIEQFAGGVRNA